ncbi:MBL fold metallo-hydrolase [Picrophilus oshimae]|uniref:MBL fold metallo-hydrolase n=1 Tax=Picrophilus oshimae TaxID=46632 RepID=UPI00064F75B5|nr:MBL fold metallo-hydrolase [Picrophilus oshimae]
MINTKVKFLGGAEEVGRLAIKIEDKNDKIMIDYGVEPDKPPEYPLPPEPVNDIFITHAHLDHTGALPVYYHNYSAKLHATAMTANSVVPIINDSLKIMRLENYVERFNEDDVENLFRSLVTERYNTDIELNNLTARAYSAGHIPGSSMWRFEDSFSFMITGDLYTRDTNLLKGARPVKTDVLIMESTYAGRDHEDRDEVIKRLKDSIKETIDNGGKVILPTFAIGRTQEMIMILRDMNYNIYVDGMGNDISRIYLDTPGFLKDYSLFRKSLGRVIKVRNKRMRKEALENGDIIITTSGMLDGGPVLGYIDSLSDDPKSAIYLTGYQVEGTNGRSLMENGTIKIAGATIKPSMKIDFFDLSAHAGHSDLVKFIKDIDPGTVVLCHGDQREKLKEALPEYNFILPYNGHEFEITN